MVGPQGERRAVEHLESRREYSERHACAVVEQPRSTQRYRGRERAGEEVLVGRMLELAGQHPRYGYRRIWALLRAEGRRVNRKRVQRVWRREGLWVPRKARKRRRLGHSGNSCTLRKAEYPNHVWSYDFVHDQTEDGRMLKLLPVVDEFTRECLTLEVERSMTGEDITRVLARLMAERGEPTFIRSDNGSEFTAQAVRQWRAVAGVETAYIEPGSPWENAYSETCNSRLRDEFLDRELFVSLGEAQVLSADHRQDYNHHRPHSALGYQTPAAYAATQSAVRIPSGSAPSAGARSKVFTASTTQSITSSRSTPP